MNKEMKNIVAAAAFGLATYTISGTVVAQTTCNPATADDWNCVQYQNGMSTTYINAPDNIWFGPSGNDTTSFRFEGSSVLSYSFFGADCPLMIDGQLKYNETEDTIQIRVTDAEVVAGDALCSQINLVNFPWTSNLIPGTNDVHTPSGGFTTGTLNNVEIELFGSPVCSGSLSNVQFRNGNPISRVSYFTFSGSVGACSVSGDVYADEDNDVNAY
ncbi:MAG: hypothetical protein ACJATD_001472 [Alloalcanivorax sp.]|jgi:hypothetical protein